MRIQLPVHCLTLVTFVLMMSCASQPREISASPGELHRKVSLNLESVFVTPVDVTFGEDWIALHIFFSGPQDDTYALFNSVSHAIRQTPEEWISVEDPDGLEVQFLPPNPMARIQYVEPERLATEYGKAHTSFTYPISLNVRKSVAPGPYELSFRADAPLRESIQELRDSPYNFKSRVQLDDRAVTAVHH